MKIHKNYFVTGKHGIRFGVADLRGNSFPLDCTVQHNLSLFSFSRKDKKKQIHKCTDWPRSDQPCDPSTHPAITDPPAAPSDTSRIANFFHVYTVYENVYKKTSMTRLAPPSGHGAGPQIHTKDRVHVVLSVPAEALGCDFSNFTIPYGPPSYKVEPPPQSANPGSALTTTVGRLGQPFTILVAIVTWGRPLHNVVRHFVKCSHCAVLRN